MTPAPIPPEDMTRGGRYRIVHRIGEQRFDRQSVLVYIGRGMVFSQTRPPSFQFSARPSFGTQTLERHHIIRVTPVPESTPISVNERAS